MVQYWKEGSHHERIQKKQDRITTQENKTTPGPNTAKQEHITM